MNTTGQPLSEQQPRATFGLYLENLHPRQEDLGPRLLQHREQIRLARDAGFTSVVLGQHLLTQPIQMPSPIVHAASVIDVSGDMRLVMGVLLLPLLNPVTLAEDIASLDWLSEGRVVLGLGMGYRQQELAAMGVDIRERVSRFNEGLAVMKAIWSANPTWSFHGKHYDFEQLPGGLQPKQTPHPPLWIAADSDTAVRRAGRLGAAWYVNPRARRVTLQHQLPIYQDALDEHGNRRPTLFPIRREAFLASTKERARSMAVTYLRRQLALYQSWGQYEIMRDADKSEVEFDEDHVPDTYLVGTPEHVAELIEQYLEEFGVNHFVLRMQWPGTPDREVMSSIEMVGEHLIPYFSRPVRRTAEPAR